MDRRRRAAVFGGAGAAIAASSLALSSRTESLGGLSADFWRGFPIGVGIVLIVAAVIQLAKDQRDRQRAR